MIRSYENCFHLFHTSYDQAGILSSEREAVGKAVFHFFRNRFVRSVIRSQSGSGSFQVDGWWNDSLVER